MNLFDYLKSIYDDRSEGYQEQYNFEEFVKVYINSTFNMNNSECQGYIENQFVYVISPEVKLDFENKSIQIIV